MSYILDALTKSQRERRDGEVPTLSTPQLTAAPAKGIRIGYASGALIVLISAGIFFGVHVLLERDVEPGPSAARVPDIQEAVKANAVEAARLQASATAATSGMSRTMPRAAKTQAALAAEPSARVRSTAPLREQVAVHASTAPSRSATNLADAPSAPRRVALAATEFVPAQTTRARQALTSRAPTRRAPSGDNPMAAIRKASAHADPPPRARPSRVLGAPVNARTSKPVEDLRLLPRTDTGVVSMDTARLLGDLRAFDEREAPNPQATLPRAARDGAAAIEAPAETGQILAQGDELPPELRRNIEQLTINAHVYSAAPLERMVIINMKSYHEGERLREGPRVDEITSTGANFSFESHRFQLNAR